MLSGKAKDILGYIKENGSSDNLEIRLNYSELAKWNGEDISSGFFEYPEINKDIKSPIIVVGIKKEESKWLEVLLHEYNHYLQWKNKTKVWKHYVDLYLEAKEETEDMIVATVNMEAECELNTINFAREIEYDLNEEKYIKKVNAYLVFYQIYLKTKKWYKTPPFEDNEILNLMPKEVLESPMDYIISEKLESLYLSHLNN